MTFHRSVGRAAAFAGAVSLATFGNIATAETPFQTPPAANTMVTLAQFVEDNGASARVDFAGKLRMLSQRVMATACYVRAGVDTENTLPALIGATDEFGAILHALEFGDDARGIFGAEERRRTIVGLNKLRDEYWLPFAELSHLVSSGAGDGQTVGIMAAQSEPLLDFTKRMVSEISGQYTDPTILLQADAMVIDIAGRQRMLSQRVSKNACLMGTGLGDETTLAQLGAASEMFETSLHALYHGMPDAGIKAPPTEEISAALGEVVSQWEALKPILASVASGNADAETLAIVYAQTTAMTAEMNAIVGLYGDASKLGL